MATYTREELVRAALLEIRVIGANEAPDADDATLTNDCAQQELEDLYEEGLIPFDVDTDEIPARYFKALKVIVADAIAPSFGKPASEVKIHQARQRLWKLRQRAYFGVPTEAAYF